ARRLYQRLIPWRESLEPSARAKRNPVSPATATQGIQPQDRCLRWTAHLTRWSYHLRGRVEYQGAQLAAQRRGSCVRYVADGTRGRAGQVRELDRATGDGHQRAAD